MERIQPDFGVSHSYRYIVDPDVVHYFDGNIINLHIALLPWNRGADPNLWSALENTPSGVSIHVMTAGLDKGNILVQKELILDDEETLQSSYDILQESMLERFKESWADIRAGRLKGTPQDGSGSYHSLADKKKYEHLLYVNGWQTKLRDIRGKALDQSE